ncbi:restriction endonuclease subunit S [Aestuariibaculum marinum]|uniref:Restriction endonuclease subunit S n=1 Tax=Aestuariibaculum marinum TaxID=2683592 RepID=A0A8J6UBR2_9FLAO|nr:restriction endonuclease subunit S [Aestuariibaculum marinum]MBD0824428.1 restriction endonuclease subunit S [Aestuariibaculum marinum]
MQKFTKISDFTQVITGGTPSTRIKEYWEGGEIPWLNSGELNQDIIKSTRNYITELGLNKSAAKLLPKDSVLIALTGATTGVVGYLTFEASANQSVTGILPSENHYPKYLYYYLKSIRPKVMDDAYGGGQPHISQKYVKDIKIPLPDLATQKRIAQILDDAAALRDKTKQLLEEYDKLAQSIFLDMFGDPVTNPRNLTKVKLGQLGNWQSGGTPSRKNSSYYQGKIPWLSSGELERMYISDSREHITQEAVAGSAAKIIERGSLLLGMYDTAALKSTINVAPLTCNQAIAFSKLNESKVNTVYVYYIIQIGKAYYRRLQRGVRQKNLNLSMIKSLEILYPPIELQNQFAEKIELIEQQKELAKQELQQTEDLFNCLLQKAFKGEL